MNTKFSSVLLVSLFLTIKLIAQTNAPAFHQWALTPPMGWNSWDCFGPSVVQDEVIANADYMAENLLEFGWEYIVVDIRWYVDNQTSGNYNTSNPEFILDEYGRYQPSPKRFPSSGSGAGFKPLADYVHRKGLKFGIHIMRGIPKKAVTEKLPVLGTENITAKDIYSTSLLCTWLGDNYTVKASAPGAQEYYNSIFDLYASWGVDYVKVDDLSRPYHTDEIEMIRKAIDQCGRPMVLSMSPGATPLDQHEHAKNHANLWRTVDDLWDNWSQLNEEFAVCAEWAPYITPGAWPDADMLPLGKFIRGERATNRYTNFTRDESYTLMTLWSIFKSPLMFGGNLPDNDAFTDSLITNPEVLDMHRRSVNNRQWFAENGYTAWTANDPENGDKYLAVFNTPMREVNVNTAIANSGLVSRENQSAGVHLSADITGKSKLYLVVTDAGDNFNYDHGDWINPTLYKENGDSIRLTSLNWTSANSGWGTVQKNKSLDGRTLMVNGKSYNNGYGVNSYSIIEFDIPQEGFTSFKTFCGFDDEVKNAPNGVTIEFLVYTEDPTVFSTGKLSVNLKNLGIENDYTVRDVWDQQELGQFSDSLFESKIDFHGAKLYKIKALNRLETANLSLAGTSTALTTCDTLSLVAQVNDTISESSTPGGWIQFYAADSLIGNVELNGAGTALLKIPALYTGKFYYTAVYGGNTYYTPQHSNSLEVNVIKGEQILYDSMTLCENDLPFDYYGDTIPTTSTSGEIELYRNSEIGCNDIVYLDLTVLPSFEVIQELSICQGEQVTLGNQTFTEEGNYTINLSGASGCDSIIQLTLNVNALPVVNIGNDTLINKGVEYLLDAGEGDYTYLWNTGDTTQTLILSGLNLGEYTLDVMVTDSNQCSKSDTINVIVAIIDRVDQKIVDGQISIYPNPTNGLIFIESPQTVGGNFSVSVFSETGQLITLHEIETIGSNQPYVLDISEMNSGVYLLKINRNNSTQGIRIVKK